MSDVDGLRGNVSLLTRVVVNAPMVLWAIDANGIFTISEGRALAQLGLRPGQVVGLSAFEVYADNPMIVGSLKRGLAGDEFTYELEAGSRSFETRYCPLRDATGAVTGLLGVSLDITERRFTGKGLAGFLQKPFTPGDLAVKLKLVLG